MPNDSSTEELTAAYVNQLKDALVQKSTECEYFRQQNVKLSHHISEMELYIHEVNAEKTFHQSRATLISACANPSASPSDVVHVVTSWLPSGTDGSIACCLKIGDNWIVIDELSSSMLRPDDTLGPGELLSTSIAACLSNYLLEQIMFCGGDVLDGNCVNDPIDQSVLLSQGWSKQHDSAAVLVCAQCLWVLVGVDSQRTFFSVRCFNELLETATELVMGQVSNNITRDDDAAKMRRLKSAECVSQLLLSAPNRTSDMPHSSPDSPSGSLTHAMRIWESLPTVLGVAAAPSLQDVACDLVLFVHCARPDSLNASASASTQGRDEYESDGAASTEIPRCSTGRGLVLSATLGPLLPAQDKQQQPGPSLTHTAVEERVEILVCNDCGNIARDALIDCGVLNDDRGRLAKASAAHSPGAADANGAGDGDSAAVQLAILPLWTREEHHGGNCFLLDPSSHYPLLRVSGAVVYRKRGLPLSQEDVQYLQQVRGDSLPGVTRWLEANLVALVRGAAAGDVRFAVDKHQPRGQQSHLSRNNHLQHYRPTMSPGRVDRTDSCPELSLGDHQETMKLFLEKGWTKLLSERSAHVTELLRSSFRSEWVVLVEAGGLGDKMGARAARDDHGMQRVVELSHETIDRNPLSQALKLLLARRPAGSELSLDAASDDDDDDVIVLNHLLTEHGAAREEIRMFFNSLLNEKSEHQLFPQGAGVRDLLPLHVFCSTLTLDADSRFIVIGGRLWQPLHPVEIRKTTRDLEQLFATLEACRQKDRLYEVIAAAHCDNDALTNDMKKLAEAHAEVERFRLMLDDQNASARERSPKKASSASTLLDALTQSCLGGGTFAPTSRGATKLVVCATDAVTGHRWQLVDPRREGGGRGASESCWRHMDPALEVAVHWPPRAGDAEDGSVVQTGIGCFRRRVGELQSPVCYALMPLHAACRAPAVGQSTSKEATAEESGHVPSLRIYLLIVSPHIDTVAATLSPVVVHWATVLRAFVSSHAEEIIYSSADRVPCAGRTVSRVLTAAHASACSSVHSALRAAHWLTNVTHASWLKKSFEYLSDPRVWDSAVRDCCHGQVHVLLPLLEVRGSCEPAAMSMSGRLSGAVCVDLLHPHASLPSSLHVASSLSQDHGEELFSYQPLLERSAWGRASSLSVLHKHCPGTRKTLQSYLQGRGNFKLNFASDTLLRYSCAGRDDDQIVKKVHVFLLLPADFLLTYDHLVQLEAHISALLSPIGLIGTHSPLCDSMARLLKMYPLREADSASKQKEESGHFISVVDVESSQKSPVHEATHAYVLANALQFLTIVQDMFAANNSRPDTLSSSKDNDIGASGRGVVFELIDGTIYTQYGSSNQHRDSKNPQMLSRAATRSFFKQRGGNFKRTFSGTAALRPLPNALEVNSLKSHLVASGVLVDILPEKHLAGREVNSFDSDGDGGMEGGGDSEFDEESDDGSAENSLGSVQFIRISFFRDENDSGDCVGVGASDMSHECVVLLLRGIVVSPVSIVDKESQQLFSVQNKRQFSHSLLQAPSDDCQSGKSAVLVSSLIPLSELQCLAVMLNHSLSQLCGVTSAAVSEQVEHSHRIERYQERLDDMIGKFEHMFLQLSKPKLVDVGSLAYLCPPQGGRAAAVSCNKAATFGNLSRGESVDSTLDREKYYKSRSRASRSGRSSDGGRGTNDDVFTDSSLGKLRGWKELVDREHEGDRDFGLKADAVVASMAAKAVGVSQKIAESLASNDLKADKIQELESDLGTARDELRALEQQFQDTSQHVDLFLDTVEERTRLLINMLRRNVTRGIDGATPQSPSLTGRNSRDAVHEAVLGHLDTIQHCSAYYHDLVAFLLGEMAGEEGMNIKAADWLLTFSAQWDASVSATVRGGAETGLPAGATAQQRWKLFWLLDSHADQAYLSGVTVEEWSRLPISGDVANLDALKWCMQSREATSALIAATSSRATVSYCPLVADEAGDAPCCAVLQDIAGRDSHVPMSCGGADTIPLVDMMRALLHRLVVSHHRHAVSQSSSLRWSDEDLSGEDKGHDEHVVQSPPPRGSISPARVTLSTRLTLSSLRRTSSTWHKTAVVGVCLRALCDSFPSPRSSLEKLGGSSDEEQPGEISALCDVLVAMAGGECNVGILLSSPCDSPSADGLPCYRGVVCHGSRKYTTSCSHAQLSLLASPMTLPENTARGPATFLAAVGYQPSLLAALCNSSSTTTTTTTTIGSSSIIASQDTCGTSLCCYVACVPLIDSPEDSEDAPPSPTLRGFAIFEYSDKRNLLALAPFAQSLARVVARIWQYRAAVSVVPRLHAEVEQLVDEACKEKTDKGRLADSLQAHEAHVDACLQFEAALVAAAEWESRREGNFCDESAYVGSPTSTSIASAAKFDLSRDWLQLWAAGAAPNTQQAYAGRASIYAPPSLPAPSAAALASSQAPSLKSTCSRDVTSAAPLVNHIRRSCADLSPHLVAVLGDVSATQSAAAVHIGRDALRAALKSLEDMSGNDDETRYDHMEAVDVAALCLVTQRAIRASSGVRGHPSSPLYFLPIALTSFAAAATSPFHSFTSSPHNLEEDVNSGTSEACGWVLILRFSSEAQANEFSDVSHAEGKRVPAARNTALWMCSRLGQWMKALEMQFVTRVRQRLECFTRAVVHECTSYMSALVSAEKDDVLKKYLVCNASVAASVAYLLGSSQEPVGFASRAGTNTIISIRMHWREEQPDATASAPPAPHWVTVTVTESPSPLSSPSSSLTQRAAATSSPPRPPDSLQSLAQCLKQVQWSLSRSRISAHELEGAWKRGAAFYRARESEDSSGGEAFLVSNGGAGQAVRHLYSLAESGQAAVLEVVIRTPPPPSDGAAGGGGSSSWERESNCWEQIQQPCLFTNSASLGDVVSEHTLLLATIAIIPHEVSLLIKQVHSSLRNQGHCIALKTAENESRKRADLLTQCLQELFSSSSRECATVLQALEDVLGRQEGVRSAQIYCRDLRPKHLSVLEQARDSAGGGAGDKSSSSRRSNSEEELGLEEEHEEYHVIYGAGRNSSTLSTPVWRRVQPPPPSSPTSSVTSSTQGRASSKDKAKAALQTEKQRFLTLRGSQSVDLSTSAVPHPRKLKRSNTAEPTRISPPPPLRGQHHLNIDTNDINNESCQNVFEFQVREVVGSLTLVTSSELSPSDSALYSALAAAIGRRICDMYGDGKQKRMLSEQQKELKLTRSTIAAKEAELKALVASQQQYIEAAHASEVGMEKLGGMLRAESAALEGCRRLKRESEKHMGEVLQSFKTEFKTKEEHLVKTLESLRARCLALEKEVKEETSAKLKAQAEAERLSDRGRELEEKRRSLADEIIIGKVESTDKINDLESRMVKCQHDLARSQKLQVSAEAKLKAQSSLHEHKAKSAKEQQSALEQEVAASRTQCARLKQQVDSTSRALALCQRELESQRLKQIQQQQQTATTVVTSSDT